MNKLYIVIVIVLSAIFVMTMGIAAKTNDISVIDWGVVSWGDSPITVWEGVNKQVPQGKQWYVLVQLLDGAFAEEIGMKGDWQLMFYYRVFGAFESPEHHNIHQPLDSGRYEKLFLKIYHSIELDAWNGEVLERHIQRPSALWQVIEVPKQ